MSIELVAFQSTHPVRGATGRCDLGPAHVLFQSTHPVRGATRQFGRQSLHLHISIHAPREGCDAPDNDPLALQAAISIHAPREGCDLPDNLKPEDMWAFQSTHPVRGATGRRECPLWISTYFNPRTP